MKIIYVCLFVFVPEAPHPDLGQSPVKLRGSQLKPALPPSCPLPLLSHSTPVPGHPCFLLQIGTVTPDLLFYPRLDDPPMSTDLCASVCAPTQFSMQTTRVRNEKGRTIKKQNQSFHRLPACWQEHTTLLLLTRWLSQNYNLEQGETSNGLYTSRASGPLM